MTTKVELTPEQQAQVAERKRVKRRRYYLNRRVKMFTRLSTRNRTIYVPYLHEPDSKQAAYLKELRDKYGYAIQTEIPNE